MLTGGCFELLTKLIYMGHRRWVTVMVMPWPVTSLACTFPVVVTWYVLELPERRNHQTTIVPSPSRYIHGFSLTWQSSVWTFGPSFAWCDVDPFCALRCRCWQWCRAVHLINSFSMDVNWPFSSYIPVIKGFKWWYKWLYMELLFHKRGDLRTYKL